jgi:hypothetical protein
VVGNTFWMGYTANVVAENCDQLVFGSNVFERNPAYDYGTSKETINALKFKNCKDSTFSGLHVHDVTKAEAGIVFEDCQRCNMTGCTILDCDPCGVLVKNAVNCRFSDALIRNDRGAKPERDSLKVVGGSGNLFANLLADIPPRIPQGSGIVK